MEQQKQADNSLISTMETEQIKEELHLNSQDLSLHFKFLENIQKDNYVEALSLANQILVNFPADKKVLAFKAFLDQNMTELLEKQESEEEVEEEEEQDDEVSSNENEDEGEGSSSAEDEYIDNADDVEMDSNMALMQQNEDLKAKNLSMQKKGVLKQADSQMMNNKPVVQKKKNNNLDQQKKKNNN